LDIIRRFLGAICCEFGYGSGPSSIMTNQILRFTDLPMASKNITLLPAA
jgi:hypothetical protein